VFGSVKSSTLFGPATGRWLQRKCRFNIA
jgi:hypothetical protein